MERLRPRYPLPQSDLIATSLRADSLRGLSGNPPELLYPFSLDEKSIKGSLAHYIESLKTSGGLRQRLLSELRPTTKQPDTDSITLMTYHQRFTTETPPFNHFYFDGDHSVLMFEGDPKIGNGALISFTIFTDPKSDGLTWKEIDPNTLKMNDLIIVQLQTPTYDKPELPHVPLFPFRWEIILTGIVASWARLVGFPRILMQPAANNRYYKPHPESCSDHKWYRELNERLQKRYDGTAAAFGFKRPNEKGPFVFDFPVSTLLEQT